MNWAGFYGLLLFICGFIVGLGSVCLIASIAFLGRKSPYFSEATIRAHKVSKGLIWLGWFLAIVGGFILYSNEPPTSVWFWQVIILLPLTINGLWLTTKVSPYLIKKELIGDANKLLPRKLQKKITISFLISLSTWWLEIILLVWYLAKNKGG
jgi:Zn-dependent protease with chaperone function